MADIIATLQNRDGDNIYPIAGGMMNDSITNAMLKDNSVTTAKIADGNVTTAKIADNAVTTGKIADLNITTAKLANSAVTTAKIANSAVTPAKMSGVDTVLYNNTTGSNGTITLSSSAANFNYLKIFYRDNDSAYSSVTVYSPNGKRVNLIFFAASAGGASMYIKSRDIYINGTSISTQGTQYSEVTLTTGPGISNAANNRIYITRVVGSYFA